MALAVLGRSWAQAVWRAKGEKMRCGLLENDGAESAEGEIMRNRTNIAKKKCR